MYLPVNVARILIYKSHIRLDIKKEKKLSNILRNQHEFIEKNFAILLF